MNSNQLRVRQVLDSIGANGRRALAKYLPEYVLPTDTKGTFPAAILASFPEHKYSEVGVLTEKLVLSREEPTIQSIMSELTHVAEGAAKAKIAISKTTADYLTKLIATRQCIQNILRASDLTISDCVQGAEYLGKNVAGHPDGVFGTTVVAEVKTSSKLDADHVYFMLQLALYMSLNPAFTCGILVLPLQSTCIVVRDWPMRAKLLELVEQKAAKIIAERPPTVSMEEIFGVANLIDFYGIGRHVSKNKTLLQTVSNMIPGVPFQIFLSSNISSKLNLDDADVEAAGEWIRNNNIILYIHAPYVINLAAEYDDEWNIDYMRRTMQYGAKLGAKGVVVHVGKYTTQDIEVAEGYMAYAVQSILEQTDPACPLLIETPAGQGSEMYCAKESFVEFIRLFVPKNPTELTRIGSCIDTCHVFACGYKPSEYIQYIAESGIPLNLVHYNDSNDICGSCKDRHAPVGRGHIGIAEMTAVADYCGANQVCMVIE